MPADLTLEIIEGPGAGRQVQLERPVVIGRAADSDFVLQDGEVSRQHAKVSPAADGSAVVEDLGSANGTFVNQNELHGPAHLGPGDQLLIGVTVIQLRGAEDLSRRQSAAINVPPALAMAPRTPEYVNPNVLEVDEAGPAAARERIPELERFLDVRVRRRAQLAPLALFLLVALALVIYFATR